jgi:hypothetical protein
LALEIEPLQRSLLPKEVLVVKFVCDLIVTKNNVKAQICQAYAVGAMLQIATTEGKKAFGKSKTTR